MKNKKCLVTGGSGFVGINLVRKLLQEGNEVSILDIIEPEHDVMSKITFFKADIGNYEKVKQACKNIDHVFHTVALVPISKADKIYDKVNAGGTRNVLEACVENGVQSVVHLSSSAVYKIPKRGDVIDENFPIEPVSSYGVAKYHAEEICFEYIKKGLPVSIIRPRTVLGIDRLGIYSLLFDWIMHDKPIFIFGDGGNLFSYISASDLAEAMILCADKGSCDIFNISTDKYGTYRSDLEDLIQYAHSKSKIKTLNSTLCRLVLQILDKLNLSPLAEWHYKTIDKEYVFDISKAKRILGWIPKDSNQKMFRESYDWFKKNYDSINKIGTTHRSKLNPKLLGIINKL